MKILIVDDNYDARLSLKKSLEYKGYSVEEAVDGEQAYRLASDIMPDMIISDVLMPKMDGFKLCRRIKQDQRLRQIPFIFYTASYTDKKDMDFALRLGAERYIVKPFNFNDFLRVIDDMINEHKRSPLRSSVETSIEDKDFLIEYNTRLVQKLEQKVAQLSREIDQRQRIEEEHDKLLKELVSSNEKMRKILKDVAVGFQSPVSYISGFAGKVKQSLHDIKVLVDSENLSDEKKREIEKIIYTEIVEDLNRCEQSVQKICALLEDLLKLAERDKKLLNITITDSS